MSGGTAPRVCLSLLPRGMDELLQLVPQCTGADLLELRLDYLRNCDYGALRAHWPGELIVTLRSPAEGGHRGYTVGEKAELLAAAIAAGVKYIDIERAEYAALVERLPLGASTRIIVSSHLNSAEPGVLDRELAALLAVPQDYIKLVYNAPYCSNAAHVLELIARARAAGKQCIIHAMGPEAAASRIAGAVRGNAWTYAAVLPAEATASGQPDYAELLQVYRWPAKRAGARLFGLLAYPVGHSAGRLLHNRLFERYGINALYCNFPVRNIARFMPCWGPHVHGLSVSIPHKEAARGFAASADRATELSGVCNTLLREGSTWRAYNTDFTALLHLFARHAPAPDDSALIYGSGATTCTVLAVLRELGLRNIALSARNEIRGQALAQRFAAQWLPQSALAEGNGGFTIVINTTPVGMQPDVEGMPPLAAHIQKDVLVADVVYNPAETALLRLARERGSRRISGLDMFLRQAAGQFHLFSGIAPEIADVYAVWRALAPNPY